MNSLHGPSSRMAEGVRKKKVRSGNCIFIKRIISNVNELASAELSGETTIKLQTHKKFLESKLKVLSELNQEILEMMEDEKEMEKEICDVGDFESLMQETISKIDLLLGKQLENKMVAAKESQTSVQQSLPSTSDGQGQMTSQFAGPKLPKFKLPTFDGGFIMMVGVWGLLRSCNSQKSQARHHQQIKLPSCEFGRQHRFSNCWVFSISH